MKGRRKDDSDGTYMKMSCVPAYPPIQGISEALQLKRVI
jgi:hypothetical protein